MAYAARRAKAKRPAGNGDGPVVDGPLKMVSFRADGETLRAIEALEADVGVGIVGRRAVAIRRGLQAAAAALRESAAAKGEGR